MQDNELLGENPKSTVNAKTDMSQNDDFSDTSLGDWYKNRTRATMPATSQQPEMPDTQPEDYDVTLGDLTKSAGVGALDMVSGIGELSEQLTGYGEGLRDLAQSGSDYLTNSMTEGGRQALNANLINDEDGIKLGSGASDIDVWAMKIANGLGSLAGGFALGGGAGSLTRMVTTSMLKRGFTSEVAGQVAARTAQILESGAKAAPMIAGSHGSAMLQSRSEVMGMDAGYLSQSSEYFRNALQEVASNPNNANLTATEKVNLAKEKTADYVSKKTGLDPTTIAASVLGGAGDALLFKSLAGKAGEGIIKGALKGATTEGLSEGIENAGQTYGQNVSINEAAGTDRDPFEGVAKNAIEGAAIGAVTGSVPGAVGGARSRFRKNNTIDGEFEDISGQQDQQPATTEPQEAVDNQQASVTQPPEAEQNLDIPAYERKDQIKTPVQGNAQVDQNNMDLPAYERQGKFIDKSGNVQGGQQQSQTQQSTPQEQAQPFSSTDKETLKKDLTSAVDELKDALKKDRDDGRASIAKNDLSRYLSTLNTDEELTPEQLEVVRKNSNEIYNKYWGIAEDQEPSTQTPQQPEANPQPELIQPEPPEKEPATMQDQLEVAMKPPKKAEPEKSAPSDNNDMQSSLDDLIAERNAEYNKIRERVKSNLLKEDQNNEALIDRLAQTEYDFKYNNQESEKPKSGSEPVYQDTFRPQDAERARSEINAREEQAREAALQGQAEKERAKQPEPQTKTDVIAQQDGQPVTRSFAKAKEEARNQETDRVQGIRREARQRELDRAFGKNTFTGLNKRLRRKIQRAKGFNTEKVLDEFRNNEKRLQAYHDEARKQAEIEARKPENVKRRKSAQALFEEKISSPEAKEFAESLITSSIKNVNTTLDQSSGTVLEVDGKQTSLPTVKKQMANSIRNLANKFIGKTAALNENLRAKKAANAEKNPAPAESDVAGEIKQAAQETNTNPTDGQKDAGNYKKGTVNLQGMTVAIENPAGSTRSGTDPNGKSWSVKMKNHYGYVKGTNGADNDPVDVFIGPNPESDKVFVVDQVAPDTGKFDEHKAMLGFDDIESARKAYLSNYSKGWSGIGDIQETTVDQFKDWLNSGQTNKPFAGDLENKSSKKSVNLYGVNIEFSPVSKEIEQSYNRASHLGRGRDFNEELTNKARSLLNNLNEKGLLDTPERRDKAKELIEKRLADQTDFIKWETNHAEKYPSWHITGRSNRNMSKYNDAQDRHMREMSNRVDSLQKKERSIANQVESIKNAEQKQQAEDQGRENAKKSLERDIIGIVINDIYNNLAEGKVELAKSGRKSGLRKVNDYLENLESLDPDRAVKLVKSMESSIRKDSKKKWGVMAVIGSARSKAGKAVQRLLDSESKEAVEPEKKPQNKPVIPTGPKEFQENILSAMDGEVSKSEFLSLVDALKNNYESVKEQVSKLTKADINKLDIFYNHNPNEKKDYQINHALDGFVTGLRRVLDMPETWTFGEKQKTHIDKLDDLREKVDGMTDDEFNSLTEKLKEKKSEREKKVQERIDALTDPQTLDDYVRLARARNGGTNAFNDQELKEYDRLFTESKIEQLAEQKKAAAEIKAVDGDISYQLAETTHTKLNEPRYVVQLTGDRLGKEAFKDLASKARQLGGNFVNAMQAKRYDTIDGFQFADKDDRDTFAKLLDGNAVTNEARKEKRSDEKTDSRIEKLNEMAGQLETKADELINADRLTNTARRASMAAGQVEKGYSMQRFARTLKAIAKGTKDGKLKLLSNLSQQTQLEELTSINNRIVWDIPEEVRDQYAERDNMGHWRLKPDTTIDQVVRWAKFPTPEVRVDRLKPIAEAMGGTKGYVQAAKKIISNTKNLQPGDRVKLSGPQWDNVIDKIRQFSRTINEGSYAFDSLVELFKKEDRLTRMGINTNAQLRFALRELNDLNIKSDKAPETKLSQLTKDIEQTVRGNRNAFNDFFPTDNESLADSVIDAADIQPGMKVLEPSAGMGHLADKLRDAGADVDVGELSNKMRELLQEKEHNVVADDFLEHKSPAIYDRIVMNPPFSNDAAIDHINHALSMLKPGGRLVAITPINTGDKANSKNREFRGYLDSVGAVEESHPENSFKKSLNPTQVSTKTIIIDKPETSFSRESVTNSRPEKSMTLKSAKLAADQWLKKYKGGAGVKLRVVKTQQEAENILGTKFGDQFVHALYNGDKGEVVVVADNIANPKQLRQKLRHEILVHHGLQSVVGDSEYSRIMDMVGRSKNSRFMQDLWNGVEKDYPELSQQEKAEEVLARAAEEERGPIHKWLDKVTGMIAEALRQAGLLAPSDITQSEMRNIVRTLGDRIRNRAMAKNTTVSGIKFSKNRNLTIDEALEQDTPKDRFEGVATAIGRTAKKAAESKVGGAIKGDIGLGALTLRQLSDIAKEKLPQVKAYVDTVHRMLTQRNQLAFDAHEMAIGIRKWAARNRKAADEMFDIAHLATVEGVDPDVEFKSAKPLLEKRIQHLEKVNEGSHKTNEQMKELKELRNMLKDEPRRKAKHTELRARFYQMPEEARLHYRNMRDKYKERHNLYRDLLEQQLQNSEIDEKTKKNRIAELKSQFELQEIMAPYFPLTRFGDYWISTTDQNGEKRFMMYESEREQQAAKKKLEKSGYPVLSGFKLENNPMVQGASLGFISDLISKVDESSLNNMKKDELKDTIYQMYLQTLPSRSMRKQFMHRQKVKGWNTDALRALADNMMKGSYQLARLQYSDELTKHVADAMKAAGNSGDNQSSRYANELVKRHQWVMNPTHSPIAQKITSLGFLYMLGFSPMAAAINTTQNFVVALPMIGSKFGFGKASAELAKATKEFVTSKGSIKNQLKDMDELAAFSQWYDSGLLDSTNAHDLAGMAEGQSWKYNPTYEKAAGLMSGLFNFAEVYNRETTAIAAYRLARKNGMGHEQATKYAEDLTWEAHFDYTNANRARYMQSPTMKVFTQFKQYSQNMTYYLARNAYKSIKGMTKEEKVEARKQLLGTLGMTALFGGVSGLPLSLVYGVANAFNAVFGDDDEPYDAETEFKSYLGDFFGEYVADKIIYGAGGAGLSPRISLDGMWMRDPNRDMEGEDTWSFYAKQIAGPVLGGTVLEAMKSLDKVADGEYYRALEGVMPKVFKDGLKAYRYANEGALNYRGDAYMDAKDFDDMDLAFQALGLTPSDLSKQYQLNNARKEYEQHVLDRRSHLMGAYYLAWKQKDGSMMLDTQKAISKFNRKYPRLALTSKKIRQSIKTRLRYSRQSSKGINLNKNLRNFESEVAW